MTKNSYFQLCRLIGALLLQAFCATSLNGCPNKSSKWVDLGGDFCYIIEKEEKFTWIDAVYSCFSEGGSLASFHSAAEALRIADHITEPNSMYYIGLWKLYDGSLAWTDKSAFDYRNWAPGEPNFDYEKCTVFYSDSGKWNDIGCDRELGFICSSPKNLARREDRKVCPYTSPNWKDFGGEYCYIIELEEKTTWNAARRRCSDEGGSLASFHSIDDISVVLQRLKGYDERLHIGLRWNTYGKFKWSDRSPSDLNYWTSGEPSNAEKRCGEMSTQSGQWYDEPCTKISGYVCSSLKDTCGGDIHSESGDIHSPNYPESYGANEDCVWTITVPEGQRIVLQFQTFDLHYEDSCLYNSVTIIDGHESDSRILGTFCGVGVPGILRSSDNKMTIRFKSGFIFEERKGFSAKFARVDFCSENIVAEKGVIHSPNYPSRYGPGVKCIWRIRVPENYRVSLKFLRFELQSSYACSKDVVEIRDGNMETSPLLYRRCGSGLPEWIRSSGNTMTVVFASDLSMEASGFLAEFSKDETCGEAITADRGLIQSPNFPNNYGPGHLCVWTITVPENHKISLKFLALDIDAGNYCSDFVEIHDGPQATSRSLGKYCGTRSLDDIVSSGNKLTAVFESDLSKEKTGFSAEFEMDTCGGDIVSDSGILSSPNFPQNYRKNEHCTWKIRVSGNYTIALQFQSFDLEPGECVHDFVEVRDGHESDSPVLGKFCGGNLPEVISSSTNEMAVIFASDTSFQKSGFHATFTKVVSAYGILESTLRELPILLMQKGLPIAIEEVPYKVKIPTKTTSQSP